MKFVRGDDKEMEEVKMSRRFFTTGVSILCLTVMALVAQAQQRVYRGTNQSARQAILRLENRANLFRNSIQAWSRQNASATYESSENIDVLVRDFNDSVRRLRDRFDRRQATAADVQAVLNLASSIDNSIRHNPIDSRSLNHW